VEVVVWFAATLAFTDYCRVLSEFHFEATIEHVERPFPEAIVAEGFSVTNDATINLVHLFEAAFLHDG
jgi:hypothetical protein